LPRLWYPTRPDVEGLAYELADEMFGGYDSSLPAFALFGGEREGGALLDSALALPRQTFSARPLYRTIYDKAGVLLRSLIKNHSLVDEANGHGDHGAISLHEWQTTSGIV